MVSWEEQLHDAVKLPIEFSFILSIFYDMITYILYTFSQTFCREMCLLMFVLNVEFVWGWTIPPKVRPKGLLPSWEGHTIDSARRECIIMVSYQIFFPQWVPQCEVGEKRRNFYLENKGTKKGSHMYSK